jgi:hypothetical protein
MLPGGSAPQVDGVSEAGDVFVEIYAHQGRLRGAQVHKVARDALKLITIGKSRPDARLMLAFASAEAAAIATGAGWLAEALQSWQVVVEVVEVPDGLRRTSRQLSIVKE